MLAASLAAIALCAGAQTPPPTSPPPNPGAPLSTPVPAPAASPTPVPIVADPASASVPVGGIAIVHLSGVYGDVTAGVANQQLATASVDQNARVVQLRGFAPGATQLTVKDARGLTLTVPVRVAYNAGTIGVGSVLHITGDPASGDFIKELAAQAAAKASSARPGATIIATPEGIDFHGVLRQDNIAVLNVPVLIQGNDLFSVQGNVPVEIYNDAAPRIAPKSLMVSDFPERLTENGVLFTADLGRGIPERFLYFHYNPGDQPDRRIVLRATNSSSEPATVQFITGAGGPGPNEMQVGHESTARFLVRLIQNEGNLIQIPPNSSINLVEQPLPARNIVSNILQLRVLSGASVHLTLFAQNASDDPQAQLASLGLLTSTVRHARGIYDVPVFRYDSSWNTNSSYLDLTIGQIPLPNELQGEALSGDYGVEQVFNVRVINPTAQPQPIAIYENPRGGRATASYLIDGILVQSHGVPPFSRYKVRQYIVPAKGFINIRNLVTIPEPGSSYPLRLEIAPDDGSVAPGAAGSPIY